MTHRRYHFQALEPPGPAGRERQASDSASALASHLSRARIKQYQGGHNETHGRMSLTIDSDTLDVGQGGTTPPPQKKDTKVAYAGPASVANGAPAKVSAKLTETGGKAIGDRPVTFTLGSGMSAQSRRSACPASRRARPVPARPRLRLTHPSVRWAEAAGLRPPSCVPSTGRTLPHAGVTWWLRRCS
jgi:hypothetical protein